MCTVYASSCVIESPSEFDLQQLLYTGNTGNKDVVAVRTDVVVKGLAALNTLSAGMANFLLALQ